MKAVQSSHSLQRLHYYFLALITILMIASLAKSAYAQIQWQRPRPIPDYENPRPPIMTADHNRAVHAFYIQFLSDRSHRAIIYRTWNPDAGWSGPHDIFVRQDMSTLNLQDAYVDAEGRLHLFFFSGSAEVGEVRHTSAPVASAWDARSWTEPAVIAEQAGPLQCGQLIRNGDGDLVLVYCGRQNGIGLYAIRSEDTGRTWSAPSVVQLSYVENNWPTALRGVADHNGAFHAVWSIVSERGIGEEVYYSRLEPERNEWHTPVRLARREGNDYSAHWPSITWHNDQLIVIYQDSFPATRFMRQSFDGGDTWTEPVRPFSHVGEYEQAVLLHDSSNTLHMLLGNRTSETEIHGMWHSTWVDGRWSELTPIISGPRTDEFDPSAPQAIIVQGNNLLVAWWNNVPGAEVAWHSYAQLDAPAEPLQTLPAPAELVVSDTPTPVSTPTPTPTPVPFQGQPASGQPTAPASSSPGALIIWGIAPVLLLVIVVVVLSSRRIHDRL